MKYILNYFAFIIVITHISCKTVKRPKKPKIKSPKIPTVYPNIPVYGKIPVFEKLPEFSTLPLQKINIKKLPKSHQPKIPKFSNIQNYGDLDASFASKVDALYDILLNPKNLKTIERLNDKHYDYNNQFNKDYNKLSKDFYKSYDSFNNHKQLKIPNIYKNLDFNNFNHDFNHDLAPLTSKDCKKLSKNNKLLDGFKELDIHSHKKNIPVFFDSEGEKLNFDKYYDQNSEDSYYGIEERDHFVDDYEDMDTLFDHLDSLDREMSNNNETKLKVSNTKVNGTKNSKNRLRTSRTIASNSGPKNKIVPKSYVNSDKTAFESAGYADPLPSSI